MNKKWIFALYIFAFVFSFGCKPNGVINVGGNYGDSEAINPVSPTSSSTKLMEKSVDATVSLPPSSAIKTNELKILTNIQCVSVNDNGLFSAKGAVSIATGGATLIIAVNSAGNPVLLKSFRNDGTNQSAPISVETTADALVFIEPIFIGLSDSSRNLAREKYLTHSKTTELIKAIESAIKSDPNNPLNAGAHPDIYSLATIITKDIIDQLPTQKNIVQQNKLTGLSPTDGGGKFSDYIGVKDDETQSKPDVILINGSYAFYSVSAKRDGVIVKNSLGDDSWAIPRKEIISFEFALPPFRINDPTETSANIGDGNLTFAFTLDKNRTLADIVITVIGDIVGIKASFKSDKAYEVLSAILELFASFFQAINGATINSIEDALLLTKDLVKIFADLVINCTTESDTLLEFIISHVAEKTISVGWFKKNTGIFCAKILANAELLKDGIEFPLILYSYYHPITYSEAGRQLNGKYTIRTLAAITLEPGFTTVKVGEVYDLSKVSVTAHYDDDTTATVTGSATWLNVSNTKITPLVTGTDVFECRYAETGVSKTANFTMTVQAGIPVVTVPPAAPKNVMCSNSNGIATLTWDIVKNAESYNVYYSENPGVTKTNGAVISGVDMPFALTGLTNGVKYYVIVTAVNSAGESPASAIISFIFIKTVPPTAPQNLAIQTGNNIATLTWSPVASAASYNVYYSENPGVTKTNGAVIAGVDMPFALTGLTNGVKYYVIVTAVNSAGESPASSELSFTFTKFATLSVPQNLAIKVGDGVATLTWDLVASATSYNVYYSRDANVSKTNGTLIPKADMPYAFTGLVYKAKYYVIVTAVNSAGESPASAIISFIFIKTIPPIAPQNFTAQAGDGMATLTWNLVAGATSYNVYYSMKSGVTKTNGTVIAGVEPPFALTGLTNDTRYYAIVTAANSAGESKGSTEIVFMPGKLAPLSIPQNLAVQTGDGVATLTWDLVTNATSYNVYYSENPGVTRGNGAVIAGVDMPFALTGLMNGTKYYVIVTAANSYGESLPSPEISFTFTKTVPPNAPQNFAIQAGDGIATLTWSPVASATSYNLYYSENPGVTNTNGTVIAGVEMPFALTGLTNGTKYYVIVTAVNSAGESPFSTEISFTFTKTVPPTAPQNFAIQAGDGIATLTWSPVASATSYNLYYSENPGVTNTNGTVIAGVETPFALTGLTNGTKYYVIVTAVNSAGESPFSTEISFTFTKTVPPNAPQNFAIQAGDGIATLTWSPVASATSYNLYYSENPGVTNTNGTVISGVETPFALSGLTNGTKYYVIVTAVNSAGESPFSAEISFTFTKTVPPAAPQNLAIQVGDGIATLTWSPVASATFYNVYYSTNQGVTKSNGTVISGVETPLALTGLSNGTMYYIVVTAANSAGESGESSEVSCVPIGTFTLQNGTTGSDQTSDICADPVGNTYVTGSTGGSFPGFTNAGSTDGFVQKISPTGQLLWTRQFGTNLSDQGYAVWADSSGVYVCGVTSGALAGFSNGGGTDIILLKYSSDGTKQWQKQIGSTFSESPADLVSDGTNLYIAGGIYNKSFGGTDLLWNAYVLKCSMQGDKTSDAYFSTGGATTDGFSSLILVGDGILLTHNVSISGSVNYAYTMPSVKKLGFNLVSKGDLAVPNNFNLSSEFLDSICKDETGYYVLARTKGSWDGANQGNTDVYLAKFNFDGTRQWTRQWGTSQWDNAAGVSADSSGVYALFSSSGILAGSTPTGDTDYYIVKLNSAGVVQWIKNGATSQADTPCDCVAFNGVFIAGSTSGSLPGFVNSGSSDIFHVKY